MLQVWTPNAFQVLLPPTTAGTEQTLFVLVSLPSGRQAPVAEIRTGLEYCKSGEMPRIGADEHNFPTSALFGVPTVAVGVEPGKYPLPALVIVTAVTCPKVALPGVESIVAIAVAVTGGLTVFATIADGVPAQ